MNPSLSITGRIATFSFRRKWIVVGAWVALLVLSGVLASGLGSVLTTEQKDLSGSESARSEALLEERFGAQPLTEMIVLRDDGRSVDDPAFQQAVASLAAALRQTEGVARVTTAFESGDPSMLSADRHAALAQLVLSGDEEQAEKQIEGILAVVHGAALPAGMTVEMTGLASLNHEFNTMAEKDMAAAERFGLPVALAVMVVAFGSAVAAGVPLLLGIAAIGPALGTVALIGRLFELSFFVTNIITMIGLAVGIDYSLFIIGRYREELGHGRTPREAIGIAADSSGRAVLFSGITVLLALAGMLLVRSNIFISIGVGAMVVVLYAVAASLTLLPALLGILGRGINWLRIPFLGKAGYGTRFWGMVTAAVQRRPLVSALLSAGVLLAAALPLTTISLGVNGAEALPRDSAGYQAITALQRDFSGGLIEPVHIVVDTEDGVADSRVQEGISRFQTLVAERGDLQWLGVQSDPSGRTALIELAAISGGTGEAAQRMVRDLRKDLVPAAFAGTNADVSVAGNIGMFVDVKAEMDAKLPVVFAFVLGLSFLLLLLVFRSIAIPTKAILMNLLSVGAAYGLLVAVFQHGFLADFFGFQQVEQIEFWIPLFLFSILFGLSMDYHVFLLSRVKEEYGRTGDNTLAVAIGVKSTAGMITSAAVIMVAVFGAFAAGDLNGMQQMGFGLAVAVFLDATIIRSVLVPASMQLLGKYNWWMPSWLGWLPTLNVEGGQHAPALGAAGGD